MISGDFHRMVGVFSVGFNLLLGFTGAYWNLSHVVEDWFYPHEEEVEELPFHEKLFAASYDIDALPLAARDHIAGFEVHYISFPWAPAGRSRSGANTRTPAGSAATTARRCPSIPRPARFYQRMT
jgi:uncharacterized iron-regulated membrane protein